MQMLLLNQPAKGDETIKRRPTLKPVNWATKRAAIWAGKWAVNQPQIS